MAEQPPDPAGSPATSGHPTTSTPAAEPKPSQPADAPRSPSKNPFAIPPVLRRLFNRFPLHVTAENALPARCAVADGDDTPILFIFTDEEGARRGLPSFNPTCLKWQTYLKMTGVPFRILPSTNHASPTGALPFLLTPTGALPASKLEAYVASHTAKLKEPPPHASTARPTEIRLSLLDSALRPAYLHALYLEPLNAPLLTSLYLPANHPAPVRASLLHSLRAAAESDILSTTRSPALLPDPIYSAAEDALSALDDLLSSPNPPDDGEHTTPAAPDWFGGADGPGLFDASVFAYTGFLLAEGLVWGDERLAAIVRRMPNLVAHRERVLRRYWPEGHGA